MARVASDTAIPSSKAGFSSKQTALRGSLEVQDEDAKKNGAQ